jgi:serine/threonine protein phosphatase PrpC
MLRRRPPGDAGHAAHPSAIVDAARTDIGLVRASNEDAFLARPAARLWAVADGMGGHAEGEWASAAIVQALAGVLLDGDLEGDCARVALGVHAANGVIYSRAESHGQRMGSTVVALLVGDDSRFAVLWAGDSRAYRLRGGALVQLTTDHTQVQSKVARGLMTADEARVHPMAHILSRAVGAEAELDLSSLRGEARAGDVFLLCSDGLHGTLPETEIAAVLASVAPAQACETLIGLCHAQGAPDNVTLAVVALAGQA